MKSVLLAFMMSLSIVLGGCTHSVHDLQVPTGLKIERNATVAIMPFTGDPYTRTIASEWLTYKLKERITNTIISPAMVEHRLAKEGIRLYLKEEGDKQYEMQTGVIAPQQTTITHKHYYAGKVFDTHEFSENDLITIGNATGAHYLISGCIIKNEQLLWELVKVNVTDIAKRKVIAVFYQSNSNEGKKSLLVRSIQSDLKTMLTDDIESIADQIVPFFLEKKDAL